MAWVYKRKKISKHENGVPNDFGLTPTDSTIVPPSKPEIFLNEHFVAARYEEGRYEKYVSSQISLFAKCYRPTTSGWRSAIDRRRPGGKGRRIPSGLISKTGDFVEEKLGGGYRRISLNAFTTGNPFGRQIYLKLV